MKVIIGFWIMCFAVTVFIVALEDSFDFKEKVKTVCLLMVFITALIIGSCLIVGLE